MQGYNIYDFFIPDNELKLPAELNYTQAVDCIVPVLHKGYEKELEYLKHALTKTI